MRTIQQVSLLEDVRTIHQQMPSQNTFGRCENYSGITFRRCENFIYKQESQLEDDNKSTNFNSLEHRLIALSCQKTFFQLTHKTDLLAIWDSVLPHYEPV